ncbi:bleomycin hydrolase isoform X2 [Copidosoma floridanum]|uniref:bleomycin hydrolase isoform X2 n=1 Tax=Copidosoma floridanum TaxID=29053 RepID=UPI0006C9A386|nr:bleomycin hydrolase isoform X2 [Copidosoma floridanum]
MAARAAGVLTKEVLKELRTKFYSERGNIQAQNTCTRVDPLEACINRQAIERTNHVFQHKVESEAKPVTNQKSSGRCWLFAVLNSIRVPFIKQYNLEEFEFSQNYLFFWDKIERSNCFLHNIVTTAKRGDELDSRVVQFLLSEPINDGGQWDMIVNLVNRYGLMPKVCFPESFCSEMSSRMNSLLTSKLREYAKILRALVESGASDEEIEGTILKQMTVIYRIVGICLGIPPETFTWEYYDKSKAYHSIGPVSGLEFYEKYVKQCFNIDDKVCLVTDPRTSHPYGKLYTVDCLNNMVGGRNTIYNNQPVELLIKLCAESIKAKEPVWFGCEVSKRFSGKIGAQDLNVHNYESVFGTNFQVGLNKADRLLYGESSMTHAMVFTGVTLDEKENPIKFRVENSWGEDRGGDKGYLVMTRDWFHEFVFEAVIDKKHVPQEVLDVYKQKPTVLPAWDPMGTLAQ